MARMTRVSRVKMTGRCPDELADRADGKIDVRDDCRTRNDQALEIEVDTSKDVEG